MSKGRAFKTANPNKWFIEAVQELVRMQLAVNNKLHVLESELDHLKGLPAGSGVVLVSNHADETDPRICLELSRKCGKRFISMCNREAFDELSGLAGWALQSLGHFSVERGSHDTQAKEYAINVVKQAQDVLVIFPEGEIFYLNDEVQQFHSGAVEIPMQALVQKRQSDPNWKAFVVPMAIKYRYRGPIEQIIQFRVARMEARLLLDSARDKSSQERLLRIEKVLLERAGIAHNYQLPSDKELFEQIVATETAILAGVEERHKEISVTQKRALDASWQLGAGIREELESRLEDTARRELEHDLDELKEVAHLSSWRPQYWTGSVSTDRMAEALLKMERELYGIKRPRQLTRREVHVRVCKPIDLSTLLDAYISDAHSVRHNFSQELHDRIQKLVDSFQHQQ